MLNKVTLIGHLGRDPEIRSMQNGNKVCNFTVATSERWTDKQTGEKRERAEWHKIVIFNDHIIGVAEKYLHRGDKVYLEGTLQTRKWQDQQGNNRYSTEVVLQRFRGELVLLGSKGDAAEPQQTVADDLDDSIPF